MKNNFNIQTLFTVIAFILLLGGTYITIQDNVTDILINKAGIEKKLDKEQYYRDITDIKKVQNKILDILLDKPPKK